MVNMHTLNKPVVSLITFLVLSASCVSSSQAAPQAHTGDKPPPRSPASRRKTGTLFVADDKSFTIWMPRTPQRENNHVSSPFGPVVYILYSATDSKAAYYIGYADYPANKFARFAPEKLLGMAAEATHKKYGKGVIRDEKISYHGYRGREIVCNIDASAKVPAKVQVIMRYFLVKNRMYTVSVEHLQSTEMSEETSKYLDGLNLLK